MNTKKRGYFSLAFYDVVESPGWVGKCILLSLVLMIPVFGFIVVLGYLFGWARDIAWRVHRPFPSRIFGNEDGMLYKRGAQLFAIVIIYAIIALIIQEIFSSLAVGTMAILPFGFGLNNGLAALSVVSALNKWGIFALGSFVITCACMLLSWVALMRSALYGTFRAAFQPSRLFELIKYDCVGLLKILGMAIIVSLMTGLIALVVTFVVGVLCGIVTAITAVTPLVLFAVVLVFAIVFSIILIALMAQVFTLAMIARAMGYWFSQFNVADWGSQDSPLPAQCIPLHVATSVN